MKINVDENETIDLTEWSKRIHENAVNHGWWDEPRTFGDIIALCHSELSEALEEFRNGRPAVYYPCNAGGICCEEDKSASCGSKPYNPENPNAVCSAKSKKPEGIAVELIDCLIRILDYCGKENIDVEQIMRIKHNYNITRPFRHGGKAL